MILSHILSIIEKVLQKQLKFNNDKTLKIYNFSNHYKKDIWIYLGSVKRKFLLNIRKCYSIK